MGGKKIILSNIPKENTSPPKKRWKFFTKNPRGKQLSPQELVSIKCGPLNTIVSRNLGLICLLWVWEPWGFGFPAAIGAKVARPDKEVIDIDGDGSFIMNIQELATAKIEKINAKCLLLNNQHLGMVVQWEDRFYESVRGHTILCDPENIGGPDNLDAIYPDYIRICEGFGIKARRVSKRADLREAMKEMLEADEPYLLEVIIPYTEHVLPMIPQGKSAMEMLID